MSTSTAKLKKPTVKVSPSSKASNISTSGILKVNQSTNNTKSAASVNRKSFSLAGDSKVLDKSASQPAKRVLQVFDDHGKDVTPRPLYNPEPGVVHHKQSKILTAHDTTSATASDFLSTTCQTTNASSAGPFTRSVFGSSTVSKSSQSTMESMTDEAEDPSSKHDISLSVPEVQVRREEVKEHISDEMLDAVVDRYLTETETIWLLDIPGVAVAADSDEAVTVKERNNAYTELCKNRLGNDKYVERMMQTFSGAPKTKEVQSERITMVDAGIVATTWDMYDTFSAIGVGETMKSPDTEGYLEVVSDHRHTTSGGSDRDTSLISNASIESSTSSHIETETFTGTSEEEADPQLILQSEKFQQDLFVMERILLENILQPKQAAYRQLPVLRDPYSQKYEAVSKSEGKEEGTLTPALERLWSYTCSLTIGLNVTCMAWNKRNPDILAVGYGHFDFRDQKHGLVCCWSLKNPMWPERIFPCESGVTALDFSSSSGGQLAVGMNDGIIATYNVQSAEKAPVVDSSDSTHKHTGPVWQVKWIEMERAMMGEDKGESLISVSADGRICKWFLRKGLDCIDLMKLKRTDKSKKAEEKEGKGEVQISRQAPGLCFDFHPKDTILYLAGTEEGYIHKCSCAYNEQYLETYRGHDGPLYRITWSPFCLDVFLSCSSDWTVQLWRQDLLQPVLGFTSGQRAVFDVMWSPRCATVFGTVNEDRVEIWDLSISILDPTIVSLAGPGVKFTSLLFATETDCVLVGDSEGQVGVYQLKNLNMGEDTKVDVLEDIIRSSLSS
ncbi:WD repeat-containing protein 78 [Megalops cyprinoides]|uniref:WD repeat-containing protein 78 n=1 Tax=Megalops cyprinoides TaxID=118141 RepID=UPI0018650AA9|nr:WD repeat-containing protein 78 [Megalops cyprinoides]